MFYITFTIHTFRALTLPEGEKDDTFYSEEFQHRVVRLQNVFSGKVEQKQGIESQRYGDVIYYSDIQVSTPRTKKQKQTTVAMYPIGGETFFLKMKWKHSQYVKKLYDVVDKFITALIL